MRNTNLDLLRAAAVTMVILSHLPAPPREAAYGVALIADWFHQYGGLGVDLFFVLSGFLVSGLLFREYLTTGTSRIGRFLIRRGFKIYPAFYVFTVATFLLRTRAGDTLTRADVLSEVFFVQNYGAHMWSHTWSLAVEEHFYLLLAGLMVVLLSRSKSRDPLRRIPLFFWATTAVVFAARAATIMALPYSNETHRFPTHLQIDSLFFGVLLSYYHHTRSAMTVALRRHIPALALAATLCLVLSQAIPNPSLRYLIGHLLTFAGFGAVVMAAVTIQPRRGPLARVVASVGAQSYSIYLWHAAVLAFGTLLVPRVFGRQMTFYETVAWYVPGAFLFGFLMAKCVEGPSLQLRERLYPDTRRSSLPVPLESARPASAGVG